MATLEDTNLVHLTPEEIRIMEEWRDYIIAQMTRKHYGSPIYIAPDHPENWKWLPSLVLFQKLLDRSSQ